MNKNPKTVVKPADLTDFEKEYNSLVQRQNKKRVTLPANAGANQQQMFASQGRPGTAPSSSTMKPQNASTIGAKTSATSGAKSPKAEPAKSLTEQKKDKVTQKVRA